MNLTNNIIFYLCTLHKTLKQFINFSKLGNKKIDNEIFSSSKFWLEKAENKEEMPFWFTKRNDIESTMFVNVGGEWLKKQIRFLKENYSDIQLKSLLQEEPAGLPNIISSKYSTSHNTIHHLYHIKFFEKISGITINKISYVIEFGGGYGNLARIVSKINKSIVYIILDLPRFTELQYRYLCTILGGDKVHIVDKIVGDEIPGIYLIRNYFVNNFSISLKKNKKSLFVATWSISEINRKTQKIIESYNFFNTTYLLIAYQRKTKRFSHSEIYSKHVNNYDLIHNGEVEYITNNYYSIFKKSCKNLTHRSLKKTFDSEV